MKPTNPNRRFNSSFMEKESVRISIRKFIAEKPAIPPDMVEARFGKAQFAVEDGHRQNDMRQ